MNFKNIFIITMILIIGLGIGCVSADDTNSTDIPNVVTNETTGPSDVTGDVINETDIDTNITDNETVDNDTNPIKETEIVASDVAFSINKGEDFTITLLADGTPLANQNITFKIEGTDLNSITNENGTAKLNYTFNKTGIYTVQTIFNGDENYTACNTTSTITVVDSILAPDVVKYFKNATPFTATFFDKNGTPLNNTVVSVVINGVKYNRTTDSNGKITVNINLRAGIYTITSINPVTNETFNSTVTVLSTLVGSNVVKYFKNGTQYHVTVLDGQGRPLANSTIVINIHGKFYYRVTDENGSATLNINLAPGTYILTVEGENQEQMTNNVTVLTTLSGANIVKYYQNGTQYHVSVLDNEGNPLANKSVTININGVFYNANTTADGVATLNINLAPGNYILTVENLINEELMSNNVTVLSTINATNYKTTYMTGGVFKVQVLDKQGKPLANQLAEFNINGMLYVKVTDENGFANLSIRLRPATYICTVTANGLSQSYDITVNKREPQISIVSSTIKSGGYYQCKITYDDKPVEGVFGVFMYEDQGYGSYTNSEGIAQIKCDIPAGSYQFFVGVQDDPLYSNKMIGSTLTVV